MTIDVDPTTSPYLQGIFAPVDDELVTDALAVTGEIPAGLRGAYLRNGPNQQFAPLGPYHVFDGDGMIHALELADGTARYRNRWVESRGLLAERAAGRARYGGLSHFVVPDEDTIAEGGFMKNTANTNVIRHGGRILALMEGARPTELTPELETVGEFDYDGALEGSMTAHPKWDPATGELVFFGYSPFPPYVRCHVADASGVLTKSVAVDLPRAVMMHDFVVTAEHIVLFDLPAVFDVEAMLAGRSGIRWEPEAGARIGVLPRAATTDETRWFEVEPFFVFHFLNGWTVGDTVVVDGCRAPRMPVAFGDDVVEGPANPTLHRWTIDLAAGSVATEQLDDRSGDFPRVAAHHEGRPNRYGYVATTSAWDDGPVMFDSLTKYDHERATSTTHRYGTDVAAGEAVFARDPDGTAEDDGWLLNLVTDLTTESTDLVILDARDLEAAPVARVHLPRRVPFGFHGNWMPAGADAP